MSLATLLAVLGLCSTAVLMSTRSTRVFALVALLAAALEVTMAFGLVRFGVAGMPVSLILGGILAACGALAFVNASARPLIGAATVTAMVGVLQVATSEPMHTWVASAKSVMLG